MMKDSFALAAPFFRDNPDGSRTLIGHVPKDVATATFISHTSQNMSVSIILPLENQSQLNSLLQDLYDPKSPTYHHFLTPLQFNQQFSASIVDSALIKEYLNNEGISVTGQSSNGSLLYVTGPSGAFEHAFNLHINNYLTKDGTKFYAPDADPTIPATLAGKILAMGGLDNLHKYHAHSHQAPVVSSPKALTYAFNGSGPGGYLAPNDVKTAYNLNTVPVTGTGQNIALFELDGYSSSDVTAYDSYFSLSNVPLQNILIDGFSGNPDCTPADLNCADEGSAEVTLDIELVTAFAPGASNIYVYEAPNTTQSWIDEWTQMATDDKAKIISCSWGEPEQDSPTLSFDNQIFQQMAVQGQAVFVAAGDNGAFDAGATTLSVDEPASQPYVTAVGISALTVNANGTYNSESASIYGGGGVSADWSIPSYQTPLILQAVPAALVSATMRNVPDVVLTADESTAYAFYIDGSWAGYYGSSLSSPIWASFMARVNQGLGLNAPLGFANPLLYQIAQGSSYANDFHNITTGNNGYYPAEPGFSDATGLGSFNGLNLYNDLINQVNFTPPVAPPSMPTGLSASVGNAQVALTWEPSSGASSYNILRTTVNGGTYTLIGSSAAPYTHFIDNSVNNGAIYYYVVSAVNSLGMSPNSAQVSATPILPPVLTASAGNNQVVLTWSASQGAVSYGVERATASFGPYSILSGSLTNISYTDNSVSNSTTYYYIVTAVNTEGQVTNSALVSATPSPPALPAPTGLSAIAGNSQVMLSWSPVAGASSYGVKRATVSGGPYYPLSSVYFLSDTSYVDYAAINGTTYYYVVVDYNGNTPSSNSAQVSATPNAPTLPAPTGLIATAGNGVVTLTWNPVAGAYYYYVKVSSVSGNVWYKTANDPYGFYATNGITYYVVVSAVNSSGQQGPDSMQVSATPQAPAQPPAAPTNLTAVPGLVNATTAELNWTASAGATSYKVLRSTISGGPYTIIASAVTVISYSDSTVVNGNTYYYVVQALNTNGQSGNSNQATITMVPLVPANVIATAGNAQVTLNWTASAGATSYSVLKSTFIGGPYTSIASPFSSSYTDTKVVNGTIYYYLVEAVDAGGASGASNMVSAQPQAPIPTAPTGVKAMLAGNEVTLTFSEASGNITGYGVNIYKNGVLYASSAGTSSPIGPIAGLPPGQVYTFTVTATNAYGTSVPSVVSNSVTTPTAPDIIIVATPTGGTVTCTLISGGACQSTAANTYNVPGGYGVTLTETPNSGNKFSSWSGLTCNSGVQTGTTCTTLINTPTTFVTASFIAIPAVPTGLTAQGQNSSIALFWAGKMSSGAILYNVKRATVSGGPYKTIASSNPAFYTDTSVNNGTTYYYVVSSVNASGGESPDSAQVNATPKAAPLLQAPNSFRGVVRF